MVNLTLAILKVEFNESRKNFEKEEIDIYKEKEFNLQELKFTNLWKKNILSFDYINTASTAKKYIYEILHQT